MHNLYTKKLNFLRDASFFSKSQWVLFTIFIINDFLMITKFTIKPFHLLYIVEKINSQKKNLKKTINVLKHFSTKSSITL